jgi:EAL domain-containing protein (putative c-di-GMP-specific phosphodiesterase class I)
MLEITESAYTGDSAQVISTAKELRGMGMGFRIEMDDFGTGYSSLGMLTSLPIDALKLDMTFVRNGFGEKRDVRMIQLIIDIAGNLKVPVIAEGVETEEQMRELKAMGCDLIQGYYFSRPVPAEEFEKLLA